MIFCPCGATKTIWAVAPLGLAWKLRWSRSFAFWNSAPGMDELSGGAAGARVATAKTPPSTATHTNATYQRCRNANRPTRYKKAATAGSPNLIWDYPARLPAPAPSRRRTPAVNPATEIAVRQDAEYGDFRSRSARTRRQRRHRLGSLGWPPRTAAANPGNDCAADRKRAKGQKVTSQHVPGFHGEDPDLATQPWWPGSQEQPSPGPRDRAAARWDRTRRAVAAAIAAAFVALLPAAMKSAWIRGTVLSTSGYVAAVAPVVANPAMRATVQEAVTSQVHAALRRAESTLPPAAGVLAGPLTGSPTVS